MDQVDSYNGFIFRSLKKVDANGRMLILGVPSAAHMFDESIKK